MMTQVKTYLIVPCYNEQKRLNKNEFLKHAHQNLSFLMVNDGSKDDTLKILEEMSYLSPFIKVYNLEQNSGKANAIRLGALQLQKIFPEINVNCAHTYFGFWDADLATPLNATQLFFEYAEMMNRLSQSEEFFDSIWGSRIQKSGSSIQRSYHRHYLARFFSTLIDLLFQIKAYDTQCGAKLFQIKHLSMLFDPPFYSNWIFDIELFLRIRNAELRLLECPLKQWQDIKGSKLSLRKDLPKILRDLYLIKKHYYWSNSKAFQS